jgi:hypothetical protein
MHSQNYKLTPLRRKLLRNFLLRLRSNNYVQKWLQTRYIIQGMNLVFMYLGVIMQPSSGGSGAAKQQHSQITHLVFGGLQLSSVNNSDLTRRSDICFVCKRRFYNHFSQQLLPAVLSPGKTPTNFLLLIRRRRLRES